MFKEHKKNKRFPKLKRSDLLFIKLIDQTLDTTTR